MGHPVVFSICIPEKPVETNGELGAPHLFALFAKGWVKISSALKRTPFKTRGESRLSSCGWRFRQIRSLGH
jgi:hypothetical protein